MRKLGMPCETCYSMRPARFVLDYDCMAMCWVCKLRTLTPWWFNHLINHFDHRGMARYDRE